MPYRSLRQCTYPGCTRLVQGGRCNKHPYFKESDRIDGTRQLYNDPRWKHIRITQLEREPWCCDCMAQGYHVRATECDHITPNRGDPELFFKGPFASRCKPHHSSKTKIDLGW